jgi:hypothetical protein
MVIRRAQIMPGIAGVGYQFPCVGSGVNLIGLPAMGYTKPEERLESHTQNQREEDKMLNPSIKEVRNLVEKYSQDGAILIYFKSDQFGYTSAGATKKECSRMENIANQIYTQIQAGVIKA